MGKNFFKIVPPVGNQTYKLHLLYYDSNRNKNFMLQTVGKNDKEVPCCGGLEIAAKKGASGQWKILTMAGYNNKY